MKDRFRIESEVETSTDFATLFVASSLVVKFDNKSIVDKSLAEKITMYDKGDISNAYGAACTTIYETKDKKWFYPTIV